MIEADTEQETVEITAYVLGVSETAARMIVAIERGEIHGDEVIIEENSERAAK
jgi:hypothetical protein